MLNVLILWLCRYHYCLVKLICNLFCSTMNLFQKSSRCFILFSNMNNHFLKTNIIKIKLSFQTISVFNNLALITLHTYCEFLHDRADFIVKVISQFCIVFWINLFVQVSYLIIEYSNLLKLFYLHWRFNLNGLRRQLWLVLPILKQTSILIFFLFSFLYLLSLRFLNLVQTIIRILHVCRVWLCLNLSLLFFVFLLLFLHISFNFQCI